MVWHHTNKCIIYVCDFLTLIKCESAVAVILQWCSGSHVMTLLCRVMLTHKSYRYSYVEMGTVQDAVLLDSRKLPC